MDLIKASFEAFPIHAGVILDLDMVAMDTEHLLKADEDWNVDLIIGSKEAPHLPLRTRRSTPAASRLCSAPDVTPEEVVVEEDDEVGDEESEDG